MSRRPAPPLALAIAAVMGTWVVVSTLAIADRLGSGPPASVVVALALGAAAAAVVYTLLHDGPRPLPLVVRVRSRRERR